MKYCLGLGVIGPWPFIDISARDYDHLKTAQQNLLVLLDTEEKFGMIVDNFVEYERELLNLALDHLAWHQGSWSPLRRSISDINRRLANFLTVSRLYIDQIQHNISEVYGANSEQATRVRGLFNKQYDKLMGYRVMEAMRNSLQHKSLPITRLSYPTAWEDRAGGQVLHHRVTASFSLAVARSDKEFKGRVIEELEKQGKEFFDVTPFVRQYVDGLSNVHDELRLITSPSIDVWKTTVLGTIQRYREVSGQDNGRIVAFKTDHKGTTIEQAEIFREGLDHLDEQRKRRLPTNVSRWFVSNESAGGTESPSMRSRNRCRD